MVLRAAFGVMILLGSGSTSAQERLAPFEYRSHFEPNPGAAPQSGSRNGWESYPLAEDAGYDPTINPETNESGSSLVRDVAPTHDGDFRLGFIRRMHMVSGKNSSLGLRLCNPSANGDTPITVSIFRGVREERIPAALHGRGWEEVKLSVSASSEPISAIAVVADVPAAVQGRSERLLMKDVRLNGLATPHAEMDQPAALWDPTRELYYVIRALHPGEELVARMRSEGGKNAAWDLLSPDGVRVTSGVGYTIRHRFSETDRPGLWSLHLSENGSTTTALLLVRSRESSGLLFSKAPSVSEDLLLAIRKREEQLRANTHVDAGMNVARMDSHWLLAGLTSYFAIISNPAELAMLDAVDFRASGRRESLDESQRLLDGIARWPEWTHPWFPAHGYHSYYPVGLMTRDVVVALQFLGDDCPPELRLTLDKSLMVHSVMPTYEEYVLEDRLQFNTSNWIGNTAGAALLAALQSEDPDAAGYAIGLWIKDRDHVMSSYTSDGSYGEGVGYEKFDLGMTSLVAEVAHRVLGQSIDGRLAGSEIYMQYAAYGKDELLDYGDTHAEIAPSNVFAYMAAYNRSDSLSKLYFQHLGVDHTELLSRILWESKVERPSKPAIAPLHTSRLFAERGIVVLRDGWDPTATVVTMRAGMNYNHNHADQGSVFFAHGGILWLGEAGYADYYKDPSYSTYNIQAVGHNTLLVDENDASQSLPGNSVFGAAPRFEQCLSGEGASLVQADLTSVYDGKLESYTRTLFFRDGGPLVVIDQIHSEAPHRFTQVWHPKAPVSQFEKASNMFQLEDVAQREKVEVRSFATVPIVSGESASPMPLALYAQAEHEIVQRPAEVRVSTIALQKDASVVTVVSPHDGPDDARSHTEWRQMPDGFLIETADAVVRVQDRPGSSSQASISASWPNGALLLHGSHYENVGRGEAITFDHPVDMSLTRDLRGHIGLEIDASEATEVQWRGLPPRIDSQVLPSRTGLQTFHIPAGHTSISLSQPTSK